MHKSKPRDKAKRTGALGKRPRARADSRQKRVITPRRGVLSGPVPSHPFTAPSGHVFKSIGVMARGIGVNTSALSMILSGQRRPSFFLAARWAAFLGCSMERLWVSLYGEHGIVPKASPVAKKLVEEAMPRMPKPRAIRRLDSRLDSRLIREPIGIPPVDIS